MNVKVPKFIVMTILFLITQVSYSATEKLVLVGGLDERVIWSCGKTPCKDVTYLTQGHKLGNALKKLDGIVKYKNYEFPWSGDPVSHNEGGNLKKKFNDWFYKYICSKNEICNVSFIAHSWGTIIISDFVASLPSDTKVNIRIVATYGSPVTGAQIKWNVAPFWELAASKVKGMGGVWINTVNPNDVIAWDIPRTINRKSNGAKSTKGRFDETFPVSNSELDPQYLGTTAFRQCISVASILSKIPCATLGFNLKDLWDSSNLEKMPKSEKEWKTFFYNTHFTESYEPKRQIGYIKDAVVTGIIFDAFEDRYSQHFPKGSVTHINRKNGVDARYRYYPKTKSYLYFWIDGNLYYRGGKGSNWKNTGKVNSWYEAVK